MCHDLAIVTKRDPLIQQTMNMYTYAPYLQIPMNVLLTMEAVLVLVSILLVATTVHVSQAAHWAPMANPVMVRDNKVDFEIW